MDFSIKEKLNKGEVVFGTFFKVNSPNIAEIFGYAGFDFIIIDCEHSSFAHLDVENLVRAADGVGLSSIVRVESPAEEHILHALDSGASGVQIPGLSSVEEVKQALAYAKYYPDGQRGLSFAQRSARYGFIEKSSYIKSSNEQTTSVVHIENITMANQVEELCQVPQLDVLFVGPSDLSQSMGKPGNSSDPEVVAVIEKVFATALKNGKKVGIFVGNQTDLEKYVKLGATYIAWKSDVAIMASAAKEANKIFSQYRSN